MDIVIWVVQALLALAFGAAGFTHLLRYERASAQPQMAWMRALPRPLIALIGLLELAAAAGLILPAATRILPWLTPLAAAGLATMMAGAVVFHLLRREPQQAGVTLALGLIATFVAYGRFVLEPFS